MSNSMLECGNESRRQQLVSSVRWNGIDHVEVAADQLSLLVYFFAAAPTDLGPGNFRIEGGRRISGIEVVGVTAGPPDDDRAADCLCIAVDRDGDFSTYTLRLVGADDDTRPPSGIDPRYATIDFGFKIDCDNDHDCAATRACARELAATPDINHLARDYASFRQLMFDRLATTLPDWRERHVPDLGVTLVELLAHAGDQLSAWQDAVATEAYLDTARTRISVRRHARLVDYRLHEGCNARTWLAFACSSDAILPGDAFFVTAHEQVALLDAGYTRSEQDLASIADGSFEVFEQALAPGSGTPLIAAHSAFDFHTWGDRECCLRKGATRATLVDPASAQADPACATPVESRKSAGVPIAAVAPTRLMPGDVLIFEEVLGPTTGHAADADPLHRQAVRLTRAEYTRDGLLDQAIIEIEWLPADALTFTLCLSARLAAPDCRRIGGISVARGNVILVDHGRWIRGESLGCVAVDAFESECGCEGVVVESRQRPARFAPALRHAALVHRESPSSSTAASAALEQDPRRAVAQVEVAASTSTPGSTQRWNVRADLLASAADARDLVVETDDDGRGHLRFGDDRCGRAPTPGSCFEANYRVGHALAGNVARETITHVVFRSSLVDGAGLRPRNPLPASGGVAPESLATAKLSAPRAFRSRLERAISADDYARLAENDASVQRANARLVWTGSWHEVDVALDPLGSAQADPDLCERVERRLECFRRAGHDLHVLPACQVPLAISMHVCVKPGYLRAHVTAAVLDALGSGLRADGKPAFFHADNLGFGTPIHASDLVAIVHAIEGVQNVEIVELRRLGEEARKGPVAESIGLAAWEIARLDNDADFPEHGVLKVQAGGGR